MQTIKATEILNWLMNDSKRINLLYGGAGSGKSMQTAIYLINKFFTEKDITILVIRKTTPALKLTAYKLILDLLDKYFPGRYEHNKTDMIIRYNSNEMIFKGLDIESRIRSMDLSYVWMEEACEFSTSDYQQILLRLRKPNNNPGVFNQVILTTNPMSMYSFVYTDIYSNPDPNIAKHKSTYLNNPFLDKSYIEELQKLSGNYRKIFLDGEFGMMEGLIFPDFEIHDRIYDTIKDTSYGIDFGYVAESALTRINFLNDGKFIAEELLYEQGLTNTGLIARIKKIIPESHKYAPIYCDSAEPDRIDEMYREGLNVKPANKSVTAGIDYMIQNFKGCTASSINLIKELRFYSFAKDKQEKLLPTPLKVEDHLIDSMRYGSFSHRGQKARIRSLNMSFR